MPSVPDDLLDQLRSIWGSQMGAQDREYEHQEGMQSRSLSAQSSMHSASLANALRIARMGNETQRYGIDTSAATARRGQDLDQEARRWSNALNYLSMAAQLKGPDDWLSYLNFTRGAAANGAPAFLDSLMSSLGISSGTSGPTGLQLPDWAPIPGGAVNPPTMGGLAAAMGGNGGTGAAAATSGAAAGAPNQQTINETINMVRNAANNMGRLTPGSLEELGEDEKKFLFGTAASLGYSPTSMLDSYMRAGIGQGNSRAA